jgi:hypothetical protein
MTTREMVMIAMEWKKRRRQQEFPAKTTRVSRYIE